MQLNISKWCSVCLNDSFELASQITKVLHIKHQQLAKTAVYWRASNLLLAYLWIAVYTSWHFTWSVYHLKILFLGGGGGHVAGSEYSKLDNYSQIDINLLKPVNYIIFIINIQLIYCCNTYKGPRTKRAALCSAAKALRNGWTADLQLICSVLEVFLQLKLSCSALQKRCAALWSA